ncbi:uncharacterized protein EAF01_009621 [Botrytis porri]|uniref:Uncharacterized protein n=1 Tax=Botrytis porri TaxID=87229 RepID=A0A4Z1L401_9HELO|nr:uncharacterized protein EAF01_009621 [Botrytis porri]KAF7895659.1 hypothetical protein EAF01_009621 [Botrytis porri]TGO91509.1 hypothetical protein BPOR_0025g00030 [Botrytis porri]
MTTQPHDLTVVAALFSAIKERDALLVTIKSKDAMLEACQAQISQCLEEKELCGRAQKKLAKYEEMLKVNGLEGVEEVITKLDYLGGLVENSRSRVGEVEASERILKIVGDA